MHSRAPFAEAFQDLVYETILPSIRKYGCYQLEQQLAESMSQLAIKEQSEENLKRQLQLDREALGEAQKNLEHEQYERDLDQRYTNKLRDIVTVMKAKQRDQIIYIATTKAYAKQNRFKVGGVKSRTLLKGRLATYNTGRPIGDKMYFAYISETTDYQHLEQRVKKIIGDHIDADEMYSLHYDSLHPLIEYLADRFNEEVEHHRTLFESLVKETISKAPRVPEPILLNGAEFRKIRNGEVVLVQRADFDGLSEDERDLSNLQRKEFEDYVADQHKTKFSKRTLWNVTKVVAEGLKRRIKY
jgi:predicted Zn-dependent protease